VIDRKLWTAEERIETKSSGLAKNISRTTTERGGAEEG
jgi:hypothetical protein